jgi:hypothetical protein
MFQTRIQNRKQNYHDGFTISRDRRWLICSRCEDCLRTQPEKTWIAFIDHSVHLPILASQIPLLLRENMTGSVRTTYHWVAFMQPLLKWKAISITYYECVFVALGSSMQCACGVLFCQPWPVRLYQILSHYYINGTNYEEKKCWV